MPHQFKNIYDIIISLAINETPDYNAIDNLINDAMEENGCSWNDPYDWELMSNQDIEQISIMPIAPLKKLNSLDSIIDIPIKELNNEGSSNKYKQNCCTIE